MYMEADALKIQHVDMKRKSYGKYPYFLLQTLQKDNRIKQTECRSEIYFNKSLHVKIKFIIASYFLVPETIVEQ
jgi:hypothetical protein